MTKSEIYILSGFLGSGKSTLLKRLLEDEKKNNRKVAVMMNELGSVSIDSNIVEEDVALKELLGGCICCSIQDKLEAQIQSLLYNEKPDVIYIETTGAAHPVEVLDAILSPYFANQLQVKGIITMMDGARWLTRHSLSPQLQQLLLEQVKHADLIIINKTDTLSDAEQAKLTFEVQGINQNANCILTSYANVSSDQLRMLTMFTKKDTKKANVKSDLQFSTFVYSFKKAVDLDQFELFLRSLPDTIYRMKGYIKFSEGDYPYLFQYSYGMPIYMKEDMNYPLNLVFIGEKMNWTEIENKLNELEC
ncbi:CobW family GTP-binding protein [Bacillus sp. CGMCC 1.16607]|uniref:CobW family GTP-binding protein n=1 Tax=Bacillus sp. CGMCC 1.16607 TaxID=3351842 RepID=UPI00363637D5